jgi:hypothetical protein
MTKTSCGPKLKVRLPSFARPRPSAAMAIVDSVDRYGKLAKPFGMSCMNVAIVGRTKSPFTRLLYFNFNPSHASHS